MTARAPRPPDDEDGAPRPLMSATFWLALAFGLACILAGMAVAWLGWRGAL